MPPSAPDTLPISFKNREQFGESEARFHGVPGSCHPLGQKSHRGGHEARVPWVRDWAPRAHSLAGPRCGPWAQRAQEQTEPVWRRWSGSKRC